MAGVRYMHSTEAARRGILSPERRPPYGYRTPPHHGQRGRQTDHQPRRRAGRSRVRLRDHRRSGRRRHRPDQAGARPRRPPPRPGRYRQVEAADRAGVAVRHAAVPDAQSRVERMGGSRASTAARLRPGGAVRPGPARRDHGHGRPMSTPALDSSRERVLGTAADGGIVLAHATAARAVAAWTLAPAPRDPVRHLEVAHAQARDHLGRLSVHDPAREVPSVMTNELFSRLTDARPAPLTAPAGVGRYTYTPRKALRRVLDHALDHLNQIDQAVRLVVQRGSELSLVELDWLPPDGGWPLRRVLHHLARSERLYAAALDEALLDAEPSGRYGEACRRLDDELRAVAARGHDPSIVYAGLYGVLQTPRSEEHTSELQSPCNLVCRLLLEKKKKKKKQSFADKNKKKTDTNK